MYHKIDLTAPTEWWVDVNTFYKQMQDLRNKKVVSLANYDPNNADHVVITFDGVYQNVLIYAAPILFHFNYVFELFITSDYLGKDNSFDVTEPLATFASIDELKEMENYGGVIQWHTRSHLDLKAVTDMEVIQQELTVPAEIKVFKPNSFSYFAYPYGNFNETVKKEVQRNFKGGISCHQGTDSDPYAYNRITVDHRTKFSSYRISCIVPCYNYGLFLPEALDSLLKQTLVPDEIIIADDASTDQTQDIGSYYAQKHLQRIKYIRNEKNLGIVDNFNAAVLACTGDYIVFLGADNRFQSNYIEACAEVLHCYPNVSIAYTDFVLFGAGAQKVYDQFHEPYKGEVRSNFFTINFPDLTTEEAARELSVRNFIHGSSMFRRESYDAVGGYQHAKDIPEDYNLFYRMIKSGFGIKKVTTTLLQYRQHSSAQANHVFGLQIALNLYMVRNKELSEELKLYQKYKITKAISFAYYTKVNINKALNLLKKRGIKQTLKRVLTRLKRK